MSILESITANMGCHHDDQDHTDHNGDPCCRDCLAAWAETDDAAEWRRYAYH